MEQTLSAPGRSLAAALLIGLVASPAATQGEPEVRAPAAAKTLAKRVPTSFLRVHRDEGGEAAALQTAIARYVPASGDGGLVVDLIGVIHFADQGYYDKLNIKFEQYDALLYELVAPEGANAPSKATVRGNRDPLWVLSKLAHGVLDLSSQMEHIDYTAKNFVHADLSPRAMLKAMRDRGENEITLGLGVLADVMRQYNLERKRAEQNPLPDPLELIDPVELFVQPGGVNKLKAVFAGQLAAVSEGAGFGQTIEAILIGDRNRAAMRVFQKELAKGRKRIGIFYGAAHMPDFERRLLADFGLRLEGIRWMTAWDLQKNSGDTGLGTMLKILGDQLGNELSKRPRRARAQKPPSKKKSI